MEKNIGGNTDEIMRRKEKKKNIFYFYLTRPIGLFLSHQIKNLPETESNTSNISNKPGVTGTTLQTPLSLNN